MAAQLTLPTKLDQLIGSALRKQGVQLADLDHLQPCKLDGREAGIGCARHRVAAARKRRGESADRQMPGPLRNGSNH